ncbi:MAG: C4-type zinc ribbon domain-containing protein [Candidatus Aminicenantes bacterium]
MDIEFEKLIRLQKLDADIKNTSLFLDNIPRQIEDINRKKEESSKIVTQAKEKMAQNQKKRRDLEAEVKDVKAKISKYNLQLNDVKTNIEYKSLLKEIEEAQKNVSEMEDEIINQMLTADEIEEEIKEATQKYNEVEKKFSKEKEILEQSQKESEAKKKELIYEKEELMTKIPADRTGLYLKIFKSKNGIALSPLTGEFCSLCHMRVRPQVLNELKGNEKIILCENCGRILYFPDKKD